MTETTPSPTTPRNLGGARAFFASRGWRFAMMILLTILMAIPLLMVAGLVDERARYQREAVGEVSQRWGGPIRLAGPVIVIPVERDVIRAVEDEDGKRRSQRVREVVEPILLMPETLQITADSASQIRKRGIFEVPVHTTDFQIAARFDYGRIEGVARKDERILWDQARLTVVMSGTRSFSGKALLTADGKAVDLDPGTPLPDGAVPAPDITRSVKRDLALEPGTPLRGQSGIQAVLGDPRGRTEFRLTMGLNGAREMMFAPVARQTDVRLTSDWPHPSFQGGFLPKERDVSAAGFTAAWSIPHLARDIPQATRGRWSGVSDFGVSFFNPVDLYQKTERAAKYGILFIALTFLTVFLIERFAARPVHPAQFVLIGLAQCVFFLLLLSFAEQIGFTPAYLAASAATVGLIGIYGWSGLALRRRALVLIGALVTLYGVLYLILRSTDYALLAGSVLAFVAVALAMLMTRGEDWSGSGSRTVPA